MFNPFKRSYTEKELGLFRFLNKVKLFERLNNDELVHFLPFLHLRSYKQNEVVFFRKDPSHALYLVKSGRVALNLEINNEFERLTTVKAAEHFGDNALLDETQRIYTTIVTSSQAEIYVVPQVNIFEVFEDHPKVRAKMMTSLAEAYNSYTVNLFGAYKESFGFFNLGQAYRNP